jgi:heme O synthase-like polyprenyltransferase
MLPQFDTDGHFTKAEIVGFTIVLVLTTMLPLGGTGRGSSIYVLCMFAAGSFFLFHTANLAKSTSKILASRVVHASVIYLPVVLAIMVAWKS